MKKPIALIGSIALAASLAACSQEDIDRAFDEVDRVREITVEKIQEFDFSKLEEYANTYLGDNSKVVELLRSMPTGADMESFEIKQENGTLIVNYKDDAVVLDPAAFETAMQEISDEAKKLVTNLENVEFNFDGKTYKF